MSPADQTVEELLDLAPGAPDQAARDATPHPPGGHPEAPAAPGAPLQLSETSGTESQDLQAGPSEEVPSSGGSESSGSELPSAENSGTVTPPKKMAAPRNKLQVNSGGNIDVSRMTYAECVQLFSAIGLETFSAAQKRQLLELLEAKRLWEAEHMLETYTPYPKQMEFHNAGVAERERLLMAANQAGKTYSAAAEVAMHLTGLYPSWWDGRRFNRAVRGLAAGVTSLLVRDSMQVLLCGYPVKPLGQGMIPKDTFAGEPIMARSVTGAYDTVRVKHVSGGESVLYLRSYEQGREKIQAMTLDFIWLDEEPDADYYTEALTRTNVASGPVFMTFTPLKGMSDTVARFLLHKQGHVTSMTIHDVLHYTEEQKTAIIAQYPPHEREARTMGVPSMGSGRVYPIPESQLAVPAFPIPDHWPRLVAMDFGWAHKTAVVWAAHDRDTDTVYLYDCYAASEVTVPVVSASIRSRGDWIPVAWPHDGHAVKDAMYGEQLAQQYRNEGVNMRPTHAQFAESAMQGERKMSRVSTEAAIQELLVRMETNRLKVFSHLADWFEEFRIYHREDGLLVKVRDDLMSATQKLIMDLRFATTKPRKSEMIDHDRRSDAFY